MSDIDDKLICAIEGYDKHYPGSTIEAIKQAFADAGYVQPQPTDHERVTALGRIRRAGYKTGQEWFTRFRAELDELPRYHDDQVEILRAAKRAANLENQNTKTEQDNRHDTA